MSRHLRFAVVCACLALSGAMARAAVPVAVYPDPIQFGVIPTNSPSTPLWIYLSNTSTSAVSVTSTTITGTNSTNFAFDGYACVGTISAGQICEMSLTFTPSAIGSATASLVIVETGVTAAITIPLQGTGGNPIPTITSLSPASVYVNSATTTITFNGSGFLASSLVYLQSNSTPLPTTFVSATQIKAQIPDTVLSNEGQLSLYVTSPPPGSASASAILQVVGLEPFINNVSPTSIVAGTASEQLLVNGQNFAAGAKLQWNGTNIPATYVSSSQLQVQLTTAELATAGIIQLAVSNPSPGTISAPLAFDLTYPVTVTVLDLPANDLVWDPFAQLL